MTIRTQLTAGRPGQDLNHNEALQVRSAVKAGGRLINHNEMLQVKSSLKAGAIRRRLETTSPREDRLSLLVVRAGLKAGRRRGRMGKRS